MNGEAAATGSGAAAGRFDLRFQLGQEVQPALRVIAQVRGALEGLVNERDAGLVADAFQQPGDALLRPVRFTAPVRPVHHQLGVFDELENVRGPACDLPAPEKPVITTKSSTISSSYPALCRWA